MKAICEGRKTKTEVVHESIEQYRDVYIRTQQRLESLRAVRLCHYGLLCCFADVSTGCPEVCFRREWLSSACPIGSLSQLSKLLNALIRQRSWRAEKNYHTWLMTVELGCQMRTKRTALLQIE